MMDEATERDVDEMQISIQQAQEAVALGDALERLQNNPDFQKLIIVDYLKEQAARLGHLMSDPQMQEKSKRKEVIRELEAIGYFLSYLRTVGQRSAMAKEAIRVNQEEIDNIAAEQAQVG